MKVITAPDQVDLVLEDEPVLFLAGGITGCYRWQNAAKDRLRESPGMLLNPRRENFPINDPDATKEQISWEFQALRIANGILFWFPKETLCPIVLFELGSALERQQDLFVGCHPAYTRKRDVEIQVSLRRSEIQVRDDLRDVLEDVVRWGARNSGSH